uniref:Regulator of telomere elongation helicase 1 n=1 Tax=Cyprinus carpio TaxID=7962 RepID=A0A8C1UW48_CYPCA
MWLISFGRRKKLPAPVRKGKEACKSQADTGPLNTGSTTTLDSHVPSLKRRKLESEEHSGQDGAARLCIQYEMEMTSKRKAVSLQDALDDTTNKGGREDSMASRLSTLSLQHDKRLDDESRGGKRKIKVVQETLVTSHFMIDIVLNVIFLAKAEMSPVNPPSEQLNQGGSHLGTAELNGGDGKNGVIVRSEVQKPQTFIKEGLSCSSLLSDIKQAIGAEKTRQMLLALQAYKTSNNYDQMVSAVVSLLTERYEDFLVVSGLGLSVLIRPQHRKQFGGLLKSLTGNDCVANQDSDVGSRQPNQHLSFLQERLKARYHPSFHECCEDIDLNSFFFFTYTIDAGECYK